MQNQGYSSQGVPTTPLPNNNQQPPPMHPYGGQKSGGSWMGYAVVTVAVWIMFFDGWNTIQSFKPVAPAQTKIVVTATALPDSAAIPTARVVPPVDNSGIVVPNQPYKSVPTLAPLPTEIPPSVAAQNHAIYEMIVATLTPFPTPVCESTHPTFVTDPVQVLNAKGYPIGNVQGWSCNSEADAVASVRMQSEVMIQLDKQAHP